MSREKFYFPKTCKFDYCREATHSKLTILKSIFGAGPSLEFSVMMEDTRENTAVTPFQHNHKTLHEPADFRRNIFLSKSSKKGIEKEIIYSPENVKDFGSQHSFPIKIHFGSQIRMDNISGNSTKKGYLNKNSFRVSNC